MTRPRLEPKDWIDAGLKALSRSGFTALRADTLAKTLGVSRGSFYWHFADVPAFEAAVLDAWETATTGDVIALVERTGSTPVERLAALGALVFSQEGSLERQVRAWAAQDAKSQAVQDRVDRRRIDYVETLFREAGFPKPAARTRALFLYQALLGKYALAGRNALPRGALDEMLALMLRR